MAKTKKNLPWHIVEKQIHKEIDWLKRVIDTRDKEQMLPTPEGINKWSSNYYLYRLVAILIVSGKIKAREIKSSNLWGKNKNIKKVHRHGKAWHKKMMNIIDNYFKVQEYNITTEPNLHQGRADLGIFKKNKKDLYIEVGTTAVYKLCINLHFMKNCIILVVPSENKIIEFEI